MEARTVSVEDRSTTAREVQYLVLPDPTNPWLLARVRWPDVFQAISAAEPEWLSDPGLFDLPYDPSSTAVAPEQAAAIAASWGVELPSSDEGAVPGPSLIRRMPANWSELSPAAKRAWSIEPDRAEARARARESRSTRWRQRLEGVSPATGDSDVAPENSIVILELEPAQTIDLTDALEDATEDALTTVEDA
jgi:hypothetical protein